MDSQTEERVLRQLAHHLQVEPQGLDLDRSFIGQGGHSLSAVAFSQGCKSVGVAVSVKEILTAPSIRDLIDLATPCFTGVTKLPKVSHNVLSMPQPTTAPENGLHSHHTRSETISELIRPQCASETNKFPATEMQMSLIRGTYADPKMNVIYHRQNCSSADLAVLKTAWESVLGTEEMFHASFHLHNGTGFWTRRHRPFPWTDITVCSQLDVETELLKPPTFIGIGYAFKAIRYQLLDATSDDVCILFQVHHSLIDGYSMERLLTRVAQTMKGAAIPSTPSMLEFLVQRDSYVTQHRHEAERFWAAERNLLSLASSNLGFPPNDECEGGDRRAAGFLSDVYTFEIRTLKDDMALYAREYNITEAALYHGAWGLVISLLADSNCIMFGTATSGRTMPIPGALDVIGNLASTIPFALEIDQNLTTADFLQVVLCKLSTLVSFDWALPDSCFDRNFSSILALQFDQSMPNGGNKAVTEWTSRMNTEVHLSVIAEADGVINIQYLGSLYRHCDIEHAAVVFKRIMKSLLKPTHTIAMCLAEAISLDEQMRLREMGNCHSALSTRASVQDSLVSLFRRTAAQYPEAQAAQKADESITYRELDLASELICNNLSKFVRQGDVVCVHADQSLPWLQAIYGVLKCGAIYCPVNPKLSASLQYSTFVSSGAKVYLVSSKAQKKLAPKDAYCIAVDEILSGGKVQAGATPAQAEAISPDSGAYLCFTSGSTGKPKGVLCTHKGLVAFQRDLEVRLFARPGWKIAQTMSVSFDGSIHEIFSALSYGATLILPESCDPFAHLTLADAAIFTPSVAKVLQPTSYQKLQIVYLVGEQVPQEVCDRWAQEKRLYNMYGPTEATCGATTKRLIPNEKVTIGKPNSSTRIYILDRHYRFVVPGWIGQVCLAGVQVSKGYIGQLEATRQKFLSDPICEGLGESMYCTGDLGYWTKSGELVLLGRTDRQIKLRGFRIDLDDVEARLVGLSGVSAAAVSRKGDDLVAMVQPKSISISKLAEAMSTVLPNHAIPRFVAAVDKFPLSKAGKLDYGQVRDSELWNVDASTPRLSELERKVAHVWQETLNLKDMSMLDSESNFSMLGGHSLLQLRLASRLSHYFSRQVPLALVIENQRLNDQARLISKLESFDAGKENVTDISPLAAQLLSPIERWWADRYHKSTCTTSFNVSFACELSEIVDRVQLEQSWDTVLARHCILSSRYSTCSKGETFTRSWHSKRPKARLVQHLDMFAEVNRPFDIRHDDLIRVFVGPSHMLVVASHILCDLTTMRLLLEDVACLYHNQPLPRPSLDYPAEKLARRDADLHQETFWVDYLKQSPESLGCPPLTTPCYRQDHTGTSICMPLPTATVEAMNRFVGTEGITNHQLAIAAVALALQTTKTSIDITIGGPYMNRTNESYLNTVGLFLEPIPLRIRFPCEDDGTSLAYIMAVRSASKAALSHVIPWDALQRLWSEKIAAADRTMFDIMVTYHESSAGLDLPIMGTLPLYTWSEGSKFPLMCEFLAVRNGTVVVRLEYDNKVLSNGDVINFINRCFTALSLLTTSCSMEDIRKALRSSMSVPDESLSAITNKSKDYFLQQVYEL